MSQPQPPAVPPTYGPPTYGPPPGAAPQPAYPMSPAPGNPGYPAPGPAYPAPNFAEAAQPAPDFAGPAYPAPAPAGPAYPAPAPAGPAYPAPAPAGPAYPAPAFAAPPAPVVYPAAPAAHSGQLPIVSCRLCGSVPAVATKFRGHQGMIVLMRFLHMEGPFCRDCGLGTFRHMTSRTLVQGWYGYGSFLITPITVLINLVRRNKVAKLPAPQPNPFGPSRQPMNPGKRLLARPMTWFGLCVPLAVIALFMLAVLNDNG